MELIIILYAGLFAYILIQKLRGRGIPWNSTGTKDVHVKEMRQENKSELFPGNKLVLRESADGLHPESGETFTLIIADRDSFHEKWEILTDDDAEEQTHPLAPQILERNLEAAEALSSIWALRNPFCPGPRIEKLRLNRNGAKSADNLSRCIWGVIRRIVNR